MFWTDARAGTVTRARLDGSEVTVLVNSGVHSGKFSKYPDDITSYRLVV